ncbi:MAG: thiopurine S-methyltransferase [Pirellulales bacterium]
MAASHLSRLPHLKAHAMEHSFWKEKWERNEIAFHGSQANRLLVENFDALQLPAGSRLFVPLCGKSLDIHWLLAGGYRVAGAELSGIAVEQLIADLGFSPVTVQRERLRHHQAEGIDIFEGDVFELSAELLGPVDAIYDRAALVALPDGLRQRYVRHLMEIARRPPQLLIAIEYDASRISGPPFSIPADEVRALYEADYDLRQLSCEEIAGGLKGNCPAVERAWLLESRRQG